MRREPTDAEKKLWSLLRRGQIEGYHFRRQVPVAGYILDFCCTPARLAIEADGGQHFDDRNEQYDRHRSDALAARGIRILRFQDDEILKHPEAVEETIYRALTDPTD
jgi:very-short-patch-repair endonuclease